MITEQIIDIKKDMTEMCNAALTILKKSIATITEGSPEGSAGLREMEDKINFLEIVIENKCVQACARFQPEAGNLRRLLMYNKMITELERVGDLSVDIADSSEMIRTVLTRETREIALKISADSTAMFAQSIDSFIDEDVEKAKMILQQDDAVDSEKNAAIDAVIALIKKKPDDAEYLFNLIKIIQKMERVADHATNIAEEVIFMCEGTVTKHHYSE